MSLSQLHLCGRRHFHDLQFWYCIIARWSYVIWDYVSCQRFIIDLLTILLTVQNKKTVIENAFFIDWRTVLPPQWIYLWDLMAVVYYFLFCQMSGYFKRIRRVMKGTGWRTTKSEQNQGGAWKILRLLDLQVRVHDMPFAITLLLSNPLPPPPPPPPRKRANCTASNQR